MRRTNTVHGMIRTMLTAFCAALMMALCMGAMTFAGVVEPSGNASTDRSNIQAELNSTGKVTLERGGTYYLANAIRVRSHQTIIADGATIILTQKNAIRNDTSTFRTDYNSLTDLTIHGGKWRTSKENGVTGTTFSFAHSRNIRLLDMDIYCTNPKGHAIELVACENVLIQGCKIVPKGTDKKKGQQEMVQIDLATPKTAPFLKKTSTKLQNGLACKNIRIIGNEITGDRAVCCNFASSEKKYLKKYHENIVIKNNTLIGERAEALAVFNTLTADITGNKIICKSTRTSEAYSIGLHVALFGKISAFDKKAYINVQNNVIRGGRQAFYILSHTKSRYKRLTIKNNKLYCKKGKKQALGIATVKKVTSSKNKTYKWNGK